MDYIDHVESLIDGFRYELCYECGKDIDGHVIGPDMFGLPHAFCVSRREG